MFVALNPHVDSSQTSHGPLIDWYVAVATTGPVAVSFAAAVAAVATTTANATIVVSATRVLQRDPMVTNPFQLQLIAPASSEAQPDTPDVITPSNPVKTRLS